jgi:hypothetical protein
MTTYVVDNDGRYAGNGSKQTVITSSDNPIIDVESNFNEWSKSAVIENLVLIGNGNNIGIRLRDVYNCQIRNVTIGNCSAGIAIEATSGKWCESNSLQHIRILGITAGSKGIVFSCADNNTSFSHTTIDDVGISLNGSNGIGIQVGNNSNVVRLNNSFIKAACWLNAVDCIGMQVYGQIKNGLVNLEVENPENKTGGIGIDLEPSADYSVYDNQSFFFRYGNVPTLIKNPYSYNEDIGVPCPL